MTKAELASIGASDALLVKEIRRYTGVTVKIPPGDSPRACGIRHEACSLMTWFWFTQPEPKKAR